MRGRTINLTFHGIGEPDRALEPGEEQFWLEPDQFASVLDSVIGRGDVRLTFDDGNSSDVEHALPALRRRNLTATFFVVAGRLGDRGFLDERGLLALASAGMGIGCHGMTHRPWRRLDERALKEELVDARQLLEQLVELPVTEAACPFGAYDRRVLRGLRRHGYRRAYTSDAGTTRSEDWLQARNTVCRGETAGLLDRIAARERSAATALKRHLKRTAMRWR